MAGEERRFGARDVPADVPARSTFNPGGVGQCLWVLFAQRLRLAGTSCSGHTISPTRSLGRAQPRRVSAFGGGPGLRSLTLEKSGCVLGYFL
jgi:hypothetical protein